MTILREAIAAATNAHTLLADAPGDRQSLVGGLAFCNHLGTTLWRLKYGGDSRVSPKAVRLFADTIRSNQRFSRWQVARQGKRNRPVGRACHQTTPMDIADRLAAAVLSCWLEDRCPACRGKGTCGGEQYLPAKIRVPCKRCDSVGWLGGAAGFRTDSEQQNRVGILAKNSPRIPHGNPVQIPVQAPSCGQALQPSRTSSPAEEAVPQTVRASGLRWLFWPRSDRRQVAQICPACHGHAYVLRPAQTKQSRVCGTCKGNGRARVNHGTRASLLGLPLAVYRSRWDVVFTELLDRLDAFDRLVQSQLRGQLLPFLTAQDKSSNVSTHRLGEAPASAK